MDTEVTAPAEFSHSPLRAFPTFPFWATVLQVAGCALFCAVTGSAGLGEAASHEEVQRVALDCILYST